MQEAGTVAGRLRRTDGSGLRGGLADAMNATLMRQRIFEIARISFRRAYSLNLLRSHPGVRIIKASPLYQTDSCVD